MRHKIHSHTFHRKGGPLKALFKGLVISLVEHGRIRTTLAKAKELRRHIDRAVTLAKDGDLGARRVLIARFGSEPTADRLIKDLGVRFKSRPGGYTRVLKMNARPGDNAPMALVEFVDYTLPDTTKNSETKVVGDKDGRKKARLRSRMAVRKKKAIREFKVEARRLARA